MHLAIPMAQTLSYPAATDLILPDWGKQDHNQFSLIFRCYQSMEKTKLKVTDGRGKLYGSNPETATIGQNSLFWSISFFIFCNVLIYRNDWLRSFCIPPYD